MFRGGDPPKGWAGGDWQAGKAVARRGRMGEAGLAVGGVCGGSCRWRPAPPLAFAPLGRGESWAASGSAPSPRTPRGCPRLALRASAPCECGPGVGRGWESLHMSFSL